MGRISSKVRIGWIQDYPSVLGGAELTASSINRSAPPEVVILQATTDDFPKNIDLFVVHNCTQFDRSLIPALSTAPVVKYIHDVWPQGDPELKTWLLDQSRILFLTSPFHVDLVFPSQPPNTVILSPPQFREAPPTSASVTRKGHVWLGQMMNSGKGIRQVANWANETSTRVDFYGRGPFAPEPSDFVNLKGSIPFSSVHSTLSEYATFIHKPLSPEPFGRSVVEASIAGCQLDVSDNIGALYWLNTDSRKDFLFRSDAYFWEKALACIR